MSQLAQNIAPLPALAGGALIGLSAVALTLLIGRTAGVSGIVGGLLPPSAAEGPWRASFVAGLLAGGLVWAVTNPTVFGHIPRPLPLIALAGVVVGFGVSMGGGCTSGHAVCGLSRFSRRSLAATITFMSFGLVTAALWRLFVGNVR